MLKVLAISLWSVAVSLGAIYLSATLKSENAQEVEPNKQDKMQIKIRLNSIPFIADSAVQGYVLAHLTFTVNTALYKALPQPADVYLTDEAFRTIYSEEKIDFRKLKKSDLKEFAQQMLERTNKRFQSAVVLDVSFSELNYVAKADIRSGR